MEIIHGFIPQDRIFYDLVPCRAEMNMTCCVWGAVNKIEVCAAGSELSGPGICIDGIPEIVDIFPVSFPILRIRWIIIINWSR